MKIYVTEDYSPESLAWLKSQPNIELLDAKDLKLAEILLIRSHTKITEHFLKDFNSLKLIVTATSGFDHLNWKLCERKNILTSYCPEANADSAAEHTIFLILSLLKNSTQQYRSIRSGLWKNGVDRTSQLSDMTVGVIGLGRIGSRVAKICQSFNCKVVAHDPYQTDEVFKKLNIDRSGFTEVIKECDLLTLHVPLTEETHHMLNASTISELSDQAFIVNASRGSVIEESDLVSALKQKKIKGAALDVFSKEPIDANSYLLREPNLFLTPHTGAFSHTAWKNSSMEAVKKAFSFTQGIMPQDQLPLATPWFKKTLDIT